MYILYLKYIYHNYFYQNYFFNFSNVHAFYAQMSMFWAPKTINIRVILVLYV